MKTPIRPIESSLLFSRGDKDDMRLGDICQIAPELKVDTDATDLFSELSGSQILILGYPDDEGIKANGGRIGASEGPHRIRKYLYRMTPPSILPAPSTTGGILDVGNLVGSDLHLEDRHSAAEAVVSAALRSGHRIVSLGGGHDYGYPDSLAYARLAKEKGIRPLIINFDAHLDVRSDQNGINSGTPFYRLLEAVPDAEVIAIGLQAQCNSRQHRDWLLERGGICCFEEERQSLRRSLLETLMIALGDRAFKRQPIFISVDIDAFSSTLAPGASQSWPTGFSQEAFFEALNWLLARFDVAHIGIYEVSPPLDIDDRTSRLAALIAYRFMFQLY